MAAAKFHPFIATTSFSIPRPGVTDGDGNTIRVFVKGNLYYLKAKDGKNLPLEPVTPSEKPVEQATAAPGEKRTTKR